MKQIVKNTATEYAVIEDGILYGFEKRKYTEWYYHQIDGVRFFATTPEETDAIKKELWE